MKTNNKQITTLDMIYIALFGILIGICSWITVPGPVPFTLQTFGVFLTVDVLGGKRGTIAVLLYIFIGLLGVPVFSGFRGGIGVLLGATGGYVLGFIFSTLIMWAFEKLNSKKLWIQTLSMILGLLICYVFGTAWFLLVYTTNSGTIGLSAVLGLCVIPFLIPDCIKIVLVLALGKQLRKALAKLQTR